jgi:hypothetical protein
MPPVSLSLSGHVGTKYLDLCNKKILYIVLLMNYIAHYLRPTARGGQTDELRKPQFRTKIRGKPRFKTISFFLLM